MFYLYDNPLPILSLHSKHCDSFLYSESNFLFVTKSLSELEIVFVALRNVAFSIGTPFSAHFNNVRTSKGNNVRFVTYYTADSSNDEG